MKFYKHYKKLLHDINSENLVAKNNFSANNEILNSSMV